MLYRFPAGGTLYLSMIKLIMKNKLKYLFIASMIILGFAIYSTLFGKLFPYSPIIIGFSKNELSNTTIYIEEKTNYTSISDLKTIDSFIPFVENFHNLHFKKKPRIFIFKDKNSYYQHSLTKARFCAFYNGDIIISPWALKEAKSGKISLEIYMKHELSHSLIHQQSGIIRSSQYPAWLLEGIAVYSSNQLGTTWYPSKNETYDYIKKGNFMPPEYFKTPKEDQIALNVKHRIPFMYSEFACIVDFLVEKYGKDKLLLYMRKLINNKNHNKVFKDVFGLEFSECINDFRNSANQYT